MLWHKCLKNMPFHPQWRLVARDAGEEVPRVVAVFSTLADKATSDHHPGSIETWRADEVAIAFEIPEASVLAIFEAMRGRVHDGRRMLNWDKHQAPKDPTAAARMARWRDRQGQDEAPAIPSEEVGVTRNVTQSRVEESRRDSLHDTRADESSNLRVPDERSLNELRGLLVAAAGAAIDLASLQLNDLSPILGLMGAGQGPPCDLQLDVLPALRAKAGTQRPGSVWSWRFYIRPIVDRRDGRLAGAPPVDPNPERKSHHGGASGSRNGASARAARRAGIAEVVELELAQARRAAG